MIVLGYAAISAFEAVALPTVLIRLVGDYSTIFLRTVAGWDVYLEQGSGLVDRSARHHMAEQ
jgi:hypothetical protein